MKTNETNFSDKKADTRWAIRPLVPPEVYTNRQEHIDYLYNAALDATGRRTMSTVLLGQRRMGKTEIFKRVVNRLFFEQNHLDPKPEQVDVKNQLTTITLANRIYVTLPFECIGNPAGQVDMLVQTASWGGGPILLPNDDLPNHGYITMSANLCEGNFDHDGDLDGSDLAVFAADFGRTDCCEPGAEWCEGDFDRDYDVDGSDLAIFAADFGRTDCP